MWLRLKFMTVVRYICDQTIRLMCAKSKRYQPTRHIPLETLKRKVENLTRKVELNKKALDAVIASNTKHMDYLAKFARHDMGNAIQNISATIETLEGDIDEGIIKTLRTSVHNLNDTLVNLGKLILYSPSQTFLLSELITAVEIFVRESSNAENITVKTSFDRDNKEKITQPFQALLQLIHNLVINAQKALRGKHSDKLIAINASIENDICVIDVKDNGCGIPDDNIESIFEYGFTTTGGNGIGLFHAKYLCDEIGGDISVSRNQDNYSTVFTLKFPKDGSKKDTDN